MNTPFLDKKLSTWLETAEVIGSVDKRCLEGTVHLYHLSHSATALQSWQWPVHTLAITCTPEI